MLAKIDYDIVKDIIKDDPVRPHISDRWRVTEPYRQVYALYEDQYAVEAPVDFDGPRAVICVAYTSQVPQDEQDLELTGSSVAVFYTVWSYDKGAGREIVLATAKRIKEENPDVERYVTLSPLTDMAERFHLRNGAQLVSRGLTCQNFEYTV
tara:strand:+ start:11139 stop:11594 length:456 start_codon:yes stop_codon:yes gene_type:complete